MANVFQQAGNWFEKNITKPVVQAADKYIGTPVTNVAKDVKRATGMEATPIPDSVKPTVDPNRAGAMATYGKMIQQQAGQYNPAAYGPNTFQARTMTPQNTVSSANMPGVYSPAASMPAAPQKTAAPQMRTVSGVTPDFRNITTGNMANTYRQEDALARELAKLSQGQELTAGFNPAMREAYISNATAGLDKQKEQAMAALKEEQMKAGNYGSSVGQKAMMELADTFDQRKVQAGQQADLMQMEAEREDRYRNIGVDQSRTGLLTNVAGAGANMNLASTGFNRDTTSMQNQIEQIKADYARQGIQIDNDTAMQMANFSANQNQTSFENEMARTEGINNQNLLGYNSQWQRFGAQTGQAERADQIANTAQQFNIGQADTADVRNYGGYQDMLRGLSSYGSNSIDPSSMLNYEMWLQQQQQKNANAANAINATGNIAKLFI